MLNNFEIRGFRGFDRLLIPNLGRVNLFVGKNTVGKSTVLEALHLYATGSPPWALQRILINRDEYAVRPQGRARELTVASLFHGRMLPTSSQEGIRLATSDDPAAALSIYTEQVRERPLIENGALVGTRLEAVGRGQNGSDSPTQLVLCVERLSERRFIRREQINEGHVKSHRSLPRAAAPTFVSAAGVSDATIARWWDAVALRDAEGRVADCLRSIAPIDRISLVERREGGMGGRMPMVRVMGQSDPVPLKSLGDGACHLFQVALAFEFAGRYRDGQPTLFDVTESQPTANFVLIDEVEHGVHYSVHRDLWKTIFRLARLHDVQVFATTHSWDCLLGFQAAATEDFDSEGVLVRLEATDGRHRAVTFDENELSVVAREAIEVR